VAPARLQQDSAHWVSLSTGRKPCHLVASYVPACLWRERGIDYRMITWAPRRTSPPVLRPDCGGVPKKGAAPQKDAAVVDGMCADRPVVQDEENW
jgi:hypothetical protein